jgi:glyoxylase-like metal-dependent hydrolase (beta-lactamase superfamily II)
MWVTREQFTVGQGCFHAGTIGLGRRIGMTSTPFHYVYDCGSGNTRALLQAIDLYRRQSSSIDARFVSHFDDDHVCGLDRLLAAVAVDTVYIPYLDETVAILDLINAEEDGTLSGSLIEATIEPEAWFGRRGVRRVVRI